LFQDYPRLKATASHQSARQKPPRLPANKAQHHEVAVIAALLRDTEVGILLNEHIAEDGPIVFAHACQLGTEGIVSKAKLPALISSANGRIKCRFRPKNSIWTA
jgi:hypothetical protein